MAEIKDKLITAESLKYVYDAKVNVDDIVDDLETSATNKPLSAAQGVELKRLIDGKAGACVHIGNGAPAKEEVLWIDTDEEPQEDSGGNNSPIVVEIAPPDFSANEGEEGYIKNRTHYIDENGIVHKLSNKYIDADWMATSEDFIDPSVIIPEQKVTSLWSNRQMDLQAGIVYDVHINGVIYPCEAWGSGQSVYLGNNTSLTRNDYPFCIYWAGGTATSGMFFHNNTLESPIYMKVTGHSYTVYNKLPEEFLPEGVVKTVNGSKPDENGNVSISTGGGGGGSIDVTAEVGQTIVVEEVDDNGKPTKWKAAEYQPRTHWTENATILPETVVEVDPDAGMGLIPVEFTVEGGKKYTVKYNGVDYVTSCLESDGQFLLGNGGAMIEGAPVTDDPFILGYNDIGDGTLVWVVVPLDGSASVTLSVTKLVYHTIPMEYLPETKTCAVVNAQLRTDSSTAAFVNGLDTTELVYAILNDLQIFVNLVIPSNAGNSFGVLRLPAVVMSAVGLNSADLFSTVKESYEHLIARGADIANMQMALLVYYEDKGYRIMINYGED